MIETKSSHFDRYDAAKKPELGHLIKEISRNLLIVVVLCNAWRYLSPRKLSGHLND